MEVIASARAMSDKNKRIDLVAEFLRGQTTLALATTDEQGMTHVAPLFYIVSDGLSLYWLSSTKSVHSRNLKHRTQVAVAVYRHAESWKEIRGVQMRGSAIPVIEKKKRNTIIERYTERFSLGNVFRLARRSTTLYAFEPEFIRYLDNSNTFGYKFELMLA